MSTAIEDTVNQVKDENEEARFFAKSFGDAQSILDGQNNFDDDDGHIFLYSNDHYYEPPISKKGLAQLRWANSHHGSLGEFKVNLLLKHFKPTKMLSRETLKKLAFDYLYLGECYPKRIVNAFGDTLGIDHQKALNVRRLKRKKKLLNEPRFCILQNNEDGFVKFKKDEIVQLKQYDSRQDIYGVPGYYGALSSVLLNESATNFRRKFFNNGNHMGFLFVTTASSLSTKDRKMLEKEIHKSKGVGNFRSMYLHLPDRGKSKVDDLVKIIPVGEISTKDEFERIKNITRGDIVSAWRVYPELAAMIPDDNSRPGDIFKIDYLNYENEVVPFQNVFLELNEWLPKKYKVDFLRPDFKYLKEGK